LDEAITEFTRALKINPRYAEAHSNRANAYLKKGEYRKALYDLNRAKSLKYKLKPELLEKVCKAALGTQ
jgi:tetratricopeptide (TPR) repeat protein